MQHQDAWTEYWSSGSLHSCATSYTGNYGGAILDFWQGVLGRAAGASRMLDLATGNGALARLLRERAEPAVTIDAVDAAAINPAWMRSQEHRAIRFQPGVQLEALPFPDATFDLAVSQFGLEYAQWPTALEEVDRVCKPGATMAFVLHHGDSVIVQVGRQELDNIDLLLGEGGLLPAGKAILEWMPDARSEVARGNIVNQQMTDARLAYNTAMQRLSVAVEGNRAPDLLLEGREFVHGLVGRVAARAISVGEANRSIEQYAGSLMASYARTSQMLDCALDAAGVDGLRSFLAQRRGDAAISLVELRQVEGLLGWGLVLSPSASST